MLLVLLSPGSAEADVRWGGKSNGHLTASCVWNIHIKNLQIWYPSYTYNRKCQGPFDLSLVSTQRNARNARPLRTFWRDWRRRRKKSTQASTQRTPLTQGTSRTKRKDISAIYSCVAFVAQRPLRVLRYAEPTLSTCRVLRVEPSSCRKHHV